MHKFWNFSIIKNEDDTKTVERVLTLNGVISEVSWFDDEITPAMFKSELDSGEGDISVWINSPGGDCIAASQIYTMLKDYKGKVTVKIDGLAASAASVIAMAGDSVLISPTGVFMIHDPMTFVSGNADELKQAIDVLGAVKDSIINAYEIKTKLPRKEIAKMMSNETWFDANAAKEKGFVDGILFDNRPDTLAKSEPVTWGRRQSELAVIAKINAKNTLNLTNPQRVSTKGAYIRLKNLEEKKYK